MDAFPTLAAPPVQCGDLPHPALWRAHQLGRERVGVQTTGFAELDIELPGGGWPSRALTELLLPRPGIGELRLLAPALAAVQKAQRCVMLIDPPALLHAWAWQGLGLKLGAEHLVIVRQSLPAKRPPQNRLCRAASGAPPGEEAPNALRGRASCTDMLWATEQALASGHLGVLLAWLPARLPADALRRLQLAAQAHDGPAFLLRDVQARLRPSPAPLRLSLAPAGPDALQLRLFKRRGPALAQPLVLALVPVLSRSAAARAARGPATVDRVPAGRRQSIAPLVDTV